MPVSDVITDAAVHVSWVALAAFIVLYGTRSRWYRSALGRWTMIKHVVWLLVVSLAVIAIHAPHWVGRPWLRAVVWSAVAAVFVGQVIVIAVEQHAARRRRRG